MDKRNPPWTIRQVMTRAPATVRPDTSAEELNRLFRACDFGAFPVVDTHGGLSGIVTKLDLLRTIRPAGRRRLDGRRALKGARVDDIMSRNVVTVTPDDRAETAADLMIEHGLRNLPVVEERQPGKRRVVGILSRTDVLRCLAPPPNRGERGATGGGSRRRGGQPGSPSRSRGRRRTSRPR
jgi:CBS domain-containing protein